MRGSEKVNAAADHWINEVKRTVDFCLRCIGNLQQKAHNIMFQATTNNLNLHHELYLFDNDLQCSLRGKCKWMFRFRPRKFHHCYTNPICNHHCLVEHGPNKSRKNERIVNTRMHRAVFLAPAYPYCEKSGGCMVQCWQSMCTLCDRERKSRYHQPFVQWMKQLHHSLSSGKDARINAKRALILLLLSKAPKGKLLNLRCSEIKLHSALQSWTRVQSHD